MADSRKSSNRASTITKIAAGVGISAIVMRAWFAKFPTRSQKRRSCLAKHECDYAIADSTAIELVKDFETQMNKGLQKENGSSLKMLPTWVTTLPTGDEKGEFYAIDVGGTNLRVMHCILGNGKSQVLSHTRREIEIPRNRKCGKVQTLFDFIVVSFKIFLELNGKEVTGEKFKIGFCFSFPLQMEAPNIGYFNQMTKGFSFKDAKGKDVVQILKNTFVAQQMDVDIRVVCNDAVGALAAGMYADPKTEIGIILGTGTNAACIEKVGSVQKWVPGLPKDLLCPINIEWGAFTSEFLPYTKEDSVLDKNSPQPGEYPFEKMISGEGIGELCRLMILSLCEEGTLLRGGKLGDLKTPYCFTSSMVSEICSDQSRNYSTSAAALRTNLQLNASAEEMKLIRRVCEIITERASLLIGCALAATLAHVRQGKPKSSDPIVVAVDGSTFVKFEKLRKDVDTQTKRILNLMHGSQAPKFELLPYLGGSSFGAATLAAAMYPQEADPLDPMQFPELEFLDH